MFYTYIMGKKCCFTIFILIINLASMMNADAKQIEAKMSITARVAYSDLINNQPSTINRILGNQDEINSILFLTQHCPKDASVTVTYYPNSKYKDKNKVISSIMKISCNMSHQCETPKSEIYKHYPGNLTSVRMICNQRNSKVYFNDKHNEGSIIFLIQY